MTGLEKVMLPLVVLGCATVLVSYFGLLFRHNPKEAPTWTVWGLLLGMLMLLATMLTALVSKLL
jgi:inhibitor of KinA sporulation pathway (predicted exonuclease)